MSENYDLLMQRIFSQMDRNSDTIKTMGETLHKHSGVLRVLLGLVITIFLFLLTLGLNAVVSLSDSGTGEKRIAIQVEEPAQFAVDPKTPQRSKEQQTTKQ